MDRQDGSPVGLAVAWLTWLDEGRGLSPHTLRAYNRVLREWLGFAIRKDADLLDPPRDLLQEFIARVHKNGRKGSASTREQETVVLREWYKWLREGHHTESVTAVNLPLPKVPVQTGKPIPDPHWQAIWALEMPLRVRACLGLGFYCGLRVGEIAGLSTNQITQNNIRDFVRKGGGESRLPWRMIAEVSATRLPWLLPDISLLDASISFTRHTYPRVMAGGRERMRTYMRKVCSEANIPEYTPHQLRHSATTNLLRAGVREYIVMQLMNHRSFDTTMRYVGAAESTLREWLRPDGVTRVTTPADWSALQADQAVCHTDGQVG